jgi:hypothetical protein
MITVERGVREDLGNWFLVVGFWSDGEECSSSDRWSMSVKYDRWRRWCVRRVREDVRICLFFFTFWYFTLWLSRRMHVPVPLIVDTTSLDRWVITGSSLFNFGGAFLCDYHQLPITSNVINTRGALSAIIRV